jgi:hypothetical protein
VVVLIVRVGSLACDSADEAKTLIPSLATKMGDDALQGMLDEMTKLRMFDKHCDTEGPEN